MFHPVLQEFGYWLSTLGNYHKGISVTAGSLYFQSVGCWKCCWALNSFCESELEVVLLLLCGGQPFRRAQEEIPRDNILWSEAHFSHSWSLWTGNFSFFFFWVSDQNRFSVTTVHVIDDTLKGFEVGIFILGRWKGRIPSVVHLGRKFTQGCVTRPHKHCDALLLFLVIYVCVCLCVQIHGFKEIQSAFLQSGLLKLLVKKCSKGTGFSKTWLLRDLEVRKVTFCKKSGFTWWHERLCQYTALLGTQDYL